MRNIWPKIRKLLSFAAAPLLGIASPLLVIPVITSQFGAAGWTAIAIGMSSGAAGAVLVELGWGLTGPQLVASLGTRRRGSLYVVSAITRLVIFVPLAPIIFVLTTRLSPTHPVEAGIMSIATAAIGLSPAWFFVGSSQPLRILLTDSLPKLLAAAFSFVLLATGSPLALYPVILLVSTLASPVLGAILSPVAKESFDDITFSMLYATIRSQSLALTGRAASSLYLSLPTVLLAAVAPGAVAQFAAADRLQRMALTAVAIVPNSLQNWIGSAELQVIKSRRVRTAIAANAGLGMVVGLGFALLAPFVANLVFSGEVPVTYQLAAVCGLIIFCTCASRATGSLGLVALGQIGWLTGSALIGSILGVTLILWLGSLWGALGALVAMAIAELGVLATQLVIISSASRHGRD